MVSPIRSAYAKAGIPKTEVEFQKFFPKEWFNTVKAEDFLKERVAKVSDRNKEVAAGTRKNLDKAKEADVDQVKALFPEKKVAGSQLLKEALEQFSQIVLYMIDHHEKRSIWDRISEEHLGKPIGMISASAAEFGDKVARRKSPRQTDVYRVYRGTELTRLALGLLMEKNLKLSYRSELLEEHQFWRQLRVNLASILTDFVRSDVVGLQRDGKNYYFFSDGLYTEAPVFKRPYFSEEDRGGQSEDEEVIVESNEDEKESRKRRSKMLKLNTVEELQQVLFDSPLIKLPDGKLNPRVVKAGVMFLKVSDSWLEMLDLGT